jgi:glyoxylase-like metal-dependent hydrolase (beta-lactamase superfamily II)
MSNEVKFTVVHIGTLSTNKFWHETERVRPPTATCTLLEADGQRLLVDPSPGPDLLEPLLFARTGLRPSDIDAVFVTHFHGDHRFGLALFEGKPWLMASAELEDWKKDHPGDERWSTRFTPAEGYLLGGVDLFLAPGHTRGHCALKLDTEWGCLIVAGDAVMTRDFFAAGEGYHNCVDMAAAAETIARIKRTADLVVPGHDNYLLNWQGRRTS